MTKAGELLELVTKAHAKKFLSQFKKYAPKWVELELIGSVKTKGKSDKDLDILVKYFYSKATEQEQGNEPPHYDIMKRMGATLDATTEESEWWLWNGITVDLFFWNDQD